jgi:hypothetical protein
MVSSTPQRLLALLLAALAFSATAVSVAEAQPVRAWASAGLGVSVLGDDVFQPTSGRVGLRVIRGQIAVSARATANSLNPRPDLEALFGAPTDEFFDVALLAGYATPPGARSHLVVGGGPAVVWGSRIVETEESKCFFCNDWEREDASPTLGLAVEGGIYGKLFGIFGYNATVHANINDSQSFIGVTVGLAVGKLR